MKLNLVLNYYGQILPYLESKTIFSIDYNKNAKIENVTSEVSLTGSKIELYTLIRVI